MKKTDTIITDKKIDLKNLTIIKAHGAMKRGDFSAVELAQAYLDVIAMKNKDLNAYLEVFSDVVEQAKVADKLFAEEKFGDGAQTSFLTGIPFAVKDNILIQGHIASAASKMLEQYHAVYDATVIAQLKKVGAVFLGRTNMDEFAMGGSTENSAFGVTKNPHDLSRVAGGSSGGSAAAVASDMALAALGSDTGGSIRQPASFCGVVGLKPTYGAISRYGVMAMGSSLDQIGPFAKTVADAEIIFNAIHGQDSLDSTTISASTYSPKRIGTKKPVIGYLDYKGGAGIDPQVYRIFNESKARFEKLGYKTKLVTIPNIDYSLAAYYIVMPAEVSANMARFDGVKYGFHKDGKTGVDDYFETRAAGFGKEVRRRILLGTYVLSSGYYDAYYNHANAVRRVMAAGFDRAFDTVDVIMTPTAPSPAFKIGEKISDPIAMYLEDIFTVPANLTGLPAMSVPAGFAVSLPVGIQLTARHGDEKTLFEAGADLLGEK
jgi:aspartyl-tRNA(Asn)/glutamyl-tRNA(Gln) amidotransferase subunit A